MTEPESPPETKPILSVLWRGHRVEVHADASLRSGALRLANRMELTGLIATTINGARELADIGPALRATVLGSTHDIDVRLEGGRVTVWLSPLGSLA